MAQRRLEELSRSTLLAAGALVCLLAVVALAGQSSTPTPPPTPVTAGRDALRDIPAAEPGNQAQALREGRPIDPNRATVEELRLLPGVGPKLAARIVSERQRRGPFRGLPDLDAVAGIGAKTLAKIQPLLIFTDVPQSGKSQPADNEKAK